MANTGISNPTFSAATSCGNTVVLPGQTPAGDYILSVLLKRSYNIVFDQVCSRSASDKPLFAGDVHWDDPMNSSVRYESDYIPYKLATDIVLNGKAYAPGGRAVTSCMVSLRVGTAEKKVLVTGDRTARYVEGGLPEFTAPDPFVEMELKYELAYGGIDIYSDKTTAYPYPRNPLGKGFTVGNSEKTVNNVSLPNLEDPNAVLTPERLCMGEYSSWQQQPMPAGLGWFPKTWYPRALLAGIMPADRATERELRQAYAALVPASQRDTYLKHSLPDMNFAFFNGASEHLVAPYLSGGEEVITENLTAAGRLAFRLPTDNPELGIDIGLGFEEPTAVMQTVMIRMEDRQVDLVWRSAIGYPGPDWLPNMKKMDVLVDYR